jgi:hypothetical protein
MYGLPQAGILAYKQLVVHVATHGHIPCEQTPPHVSRHRVFCCMGPMMSHFVSLYDFGIKYTDRRDADRILAALKELYVVATKCTGSFYLAMHMAWDYINHTVDISMPGYVAKALGRFQHQALGRPQHSHHAWLKPQYNTHPQLTPTTDDVTILPQPALTCIQ